MWQGRSRDLPGRKGPATRISRCVRAALMSEEADYSSHAELLAFAGSVAAGAGADGDSDGDGTCDVDDAAGGGGGGGGGGGRTHLSGALAMTWLLHEAGAAGGGEAGADAADEAAEDAHAEARGADARGAGADGSGGGGAGAAAAAAEPYTPIAAKKFPPEWAMLAKAVWASYGSTEAVVRAQLAPTFSGDELVFSWLAAAPFLPGHLILISKALEAVVVVIRGTANMFDVSADFRWRPVPMPGLLLAHEGMVACAERLLGPAHGATVLAGLRASGALPPAAASGRRPPVTLFDALAALLESRPGWTLLFTGHSLGGGVSAVLEQLALQHWHTLEGSSWCATASTR